MAQHDSSGWTTPNRRNRRRVGRNTAGDSCQATTTPFARSGRATQMQEFPVARHVKHSVRQAFSFTVGSSATLTHTWTCGAPRKYQTNDGPSSRQLSHTPSSPMSPSW